MIKMNRIIKIVTIILLFCVSHGMSAYLSSYTWCKIKTDKGYVDIKLLGDTHKPEYADDVFYERLKDGIEIWAQEPQKTLLLTEFREKLGLGNRFWETVRQGLSKIDLTFVFDTVTMNKFPRYLAYVQNKYQNSNLHIDYKADDRLDDAIAELSLGNDLRKILKIFFTTNWQAVLNAPLILRLFKINLSEITNSMQLYSATIDSYNNRFPEYKSLLEAFKQRATTASLFFENAFAQLRKDNKPLNVMSLVVNADSNAVLDYLWQIFVVDKADLGFIMRILAHYKKYNRIILYAGAGHTQRIHSLLKQIFGDKLTYVADIGEKENDAPLFQDLMLVNEKHLENKIMCFKCAKIFSQKYACRSCKQATYCSQVCHDQDTIKEYHCTQQVSTKNMIQAKATGLLQNSLKYPLLLIGIPIGCIGITAIGYGIWEYIRYKRIVHNIYALDQVIKGLNTELHDQKTIIALIKKWESALTLFDKKEKQRLYKYIYDGDFKLCADFLEKKRIDLVTACRKKRLFTLPKWFTHKK